MSNVVTAFMVIDDDDDTTGIVPERLAYTTAPCGGAEKELRFVAATVMKPCMGIPIDSEPRKMLNVN